MIKKFILGCLVSSFMFMIGQAKAENLMMVVNTWPPYVEKSLPGDGLAVAIVTQAMRGKGYQVSLQYETWPRALEGLDIGIFDMLGAVWKTPEREKYMLFSEPYLTNQIKFLKRKADDIKFETLDDITGYFIGVVNDYAYEEEFVNSRRHIKLPQNHIIQNLQRLVQGEIDMTLGDQRAIVYEINKFMPHRMKDLVFLAKPLSTRGLRIGVSRQHPHAKKIIADFNLTIKTMQQDGRYQTILDQFNNTP